MTTKMTTTISEVLEFVEENDVKFIRLAFCDVFGVQKNISVMPEELSSAFEHGIPFDASAIKGFNDVENSDLLLFPDPATLTVLPWRPGPGRVVRFYCDVRNPDGTSYVHDSRYILKKVIKRCEGMGYVCKIGAECEFYLFKTDEDGEPTKVTLDKGGYLDISPMDKCENIRREICLCLEEMGIKPETSHHERGPGQNEIDFKFSDALNCADNLLTFKSVVKAIASRNGLHASFLPKPIEREAGSGLHVNISLSKGGFNVFKKEEGKHSDVMESFIAGVLERTPEITLFLNPIPNSYERFGEFEAPRYVSWSRQNRSQLVRIPAADGEKIRMELRSPDPTVNPYLAYALVMAAGLDGIERSLNLPQSFDKNLYTIDEDMTKSLEKLPDDLGEAINLAKSSDFIKNILGEALLEKYVELKTRELDELNKVMHNDRESYFKAKYFDRV